MAGEPPKSNPEEPAFYRRLALGFEAVHDAAVVPSRVAQLELSKDEEQQHIQREINRKLWTPRLPNAGDLERKWLHSLRGFARDGTLVQIVQIAAGLYAAALEKCLPAQEWLRIEGKTVRVPGCYYIRRPVTPKTNKALFEAATNLRGEAEAAKHRRKKWLAQFLLDGMPVAVSNFKMRVLYLLRHADGLVERLVKLMNVEGEESQGGVMGDGSILPNNMWAGSEKFREQVGAMGNFTWGGEGGAGNMELQALQLDVTKELAHKEVKLIEAVGWHPLPGKKTAGAPGRDVLAGFWVFKECVIADRILFRPDADGAFWHHDVGYVLGKNGRELEYAQGKPDFLPDLAIDRVQFDRSDWEQPAADSQEQPTSNDLYENENRLGGFYREICRRMYDTAGGYPGWLGVASMLGFAAQPEVFAHYRSFSAPWVTGQFQSGKTTFAGWLMAFWGLPQLTGGMALLSKQTTAVGIMCQLENYSCVPLWLDEFRDRELKGSDKEPILRDAYCRQIGSKWTPDGQQRQIQTMVMVSGESTSSDGATRSRYPHILIAEELRKANHFQWLNDHREYFCLITRELLLRRQEFVPLVMAEMGAWMEDEAMAKQPARNKLAHAVAWAAFAAAARLLRSHGEEELQAYRRWLMDYVARAVRDVQSDVNVNVFLQDLVTAYRAGAIPNGCFRLEVRRVPHEPGHPDRGYWEEVILYLDAELAIASLNKELRKAGSSLPLRMKDIRDQLSQQDFWLKPEKNSQIMKRFGPKGSRATKAAWGIMLDRHPLGRREVSDAEYESALKPVNECLPGAGMELGPQFKDGDPRRGPLYEIVDGWLEWDRQQDNP